MPKTSKFQTWYFRVLIAFFAVVVLGPMIYFGYRLLAPSPLVGECVKQVNHSAAELTFEEERCSGRRTAREFEVGAIAAACPPGDYTAVTTGDEQTCYLPALSNGVCFVTKQFNNTRQPVFVRGDCKAPGARKVENNIQDVNDKSRCKNPDISLAFSEPARTVCMVQP